MKMRARTLVPLAVTALAGAALGLLAVDAPAGAASSGSTGATGAVAISGVSGGAASITGVSGATGGSGTAVPKTPEEAVASGKTLFVENCASCHEPDGVGSGRAPNLRGVGAATVDLWLRTGWMPLSEPGAQPETKPPRFTSEEIAQIVAYVTSLAPGGVPIPDVNADAGSVQIGFDLFSLNCAGCHTITGAGDALANGIQAPSLHGVHAVQIAEAIETGPGNMPRFSKYQFSPAELNSIVAYILHYIQTPTSPGGISLGGVGPVAEGFVGLFVGVGACVLIGFWIGDRTEKDEDEGHGDGHGEHGDDSHGGGEAETGETDHETAGGEDAAGQGGTEPADG
jgi:ubiquinol-cytochrome c reductase cytochrome c subunit